MIFAKLNNKPETKILFPYNINMINIIKDKKVVLYLKKKTKTFYLYLQKEFG